MAEWRIETLGALHEEFNEAEFSGKLGTPRFGLTRSRNTDGYYEHFTNGRMKSSIVISKYCFEDDDLLRGTMLHEMIHQYQHEILKRTCNHDAIFCSIARRLERKYKFTVR